MNRGWFRVLLLAAGGGACLLRADEAEPPAFAKEWLGCWQSAENEKSLLRFEPARCTLSEDGRRQFMAARYVPGKVVLRAWGQQVEFDVTLADGVLSLTARAKTVRFKKVPDVPEALTLRPLKLGAAGDVPAPRLAEIKAEFARREVEDQAVRKDPSRQGEMPKVDAANTAYLAGVVKELGWIDVPRFGAPAANTAFLIVQHRGDLPLMAACLPEIEKDVKAKRLDGQNFALLYDRRQLDLGGKQRYGSQIGRDAAGELMVLPLEDRANVERLRSELGIFPLVQYLEMCKRMNGGQEVKFLEE